MTQTDTEIEWPREIWMAERDEHDQGVVRAVLSEHATVARWEGDSERDREFHHYIDADIYVSAQRYHDTKLAAITAERDTLAKQAEDCARSCAEQAEVIQTLTGQLAEARGTLDRIDVIAEVADAAPLCMGEIRELIKMNRALKSEPAPRPKSKAVPSSAAVEVCGICDIAGCHHTRELNEKMPNEIAAWPEFPDGCVTGSWSANQHHQDAVAYVRKDPALRHSDDTAVDRFAAAMKAKLAAKRADGRGGWDDKTQCSQQFLSDLLRAHVDKGDPVDVANFAMMLHQRGEVIAPAPGHLDDECKRCGSVGGFGCYECTPAPSQIERVSLADLEGYGTNSAPRQSVQEAARVLLEWTGDYIPTVPKLAAVKAHLAHDNKTQPVAISAAWIAALQAIAQEAQGDE